ncbi:MAG TPA: GNAT family N-acetyltransferase [Arenibaculum sp.]|nr:GNAT family N-acetyltransferase [Arenibaculum sp.]
MRTRIRRAMIGDDRSIARVHVEGWRETYPGVVPDRVLNRLDVEDRRWFWRAALIERSGDRDFFVAESGGRVVGFGVCGEEQVGLEEFDGEFHALYVLRAGQGRGLGTRLMREMAAALAARGRTAATVWVLRDNWRARRFYEKLGGRLIADRPLDFDGTRVMEVAYGWTDITPLACAATSRGAAGRGTTWLP